MAINSLFLSNYNDTDAQAVFDSLTVESIQIMGHDYLYIPREFVAEDKLYGEDVRSAFNRVFTLEMYIKNVQGFEGEKEIFQKFGLEMREEMDLSVSITRFQQEVTSVLSNIVKPREGDLVYVPFANILFEIMLTRDEEFFFQTGKLFTYGLRLKRFELGGEQFNTGVTAVDTIEIEKGYAIELEFDSGFGTYTLGETVYQGDDVASATFTARVQSWNDATKVLRLNRTVGSLLNESSLEGDDSGAVYVVDKTKLEKNINDKRVDNEVMTEINPTLVDTSDVNNFTEY